MTKRYEVLLADDLDKQLRKRFPGMAGSAAIRQCVIESTGYSGPRFSQEELKAMGRAMAEAAKPDLDEIIARAIKEQEDRGQE